MSHPTPVRHLQYKGFEAWIVVDDQPLPQFAVEYKGETREGTAWITSESGNRFSICYRKLDIPEFSRFKYNDFAAKVYLDGREVFVGAYKSWSTGETQTISCIEISPIMGRDFISGSADLTDDDAFLSHSSAAQFGEIRIKFPTNVEMIRPDVPGINCPDSSKMHERLKKGCDHQIKYSEAKSIITRGTCHQANLWPLDDPVIFIFKYRPLEMLQANGIAPRPPPAQCLDGKDESDKESDDENDEIVKKERTLLAALEEVRRLKCSRNEIDRPTKRIKTEHSEIKYSPPQIVDLTGEQDGLRRSSSSRHVEVIDLTL